MPATSGCKGATQINLKERGQVFHQHFICEGFHL